LLLLASLKEKSTSRELDYFLEVVDENSLEGNDLAYEAVEDGFALF